MRSGRIPIFIEYSARRAERFPERTDANVASASTIVPPAVAREAIVVQSVIRPTTYGLGGPRAHGSLSFEHVQRDPFITDPGHLAELAGKAYTCVRPAGEIADAFFVLQRAIREAIGPEEGSWPSPHMSLRGFGTMDHPVDAAMTRRILGVVAAWAERASPLQLIAEGGDVFDEDRIPILRIRRTPTLEAAFADLRFRCEAANLVGYEDGISVDDWIFHLSLVYYEGDAWLDVVAAIEGLSVPEASCIVDSVELVGFDGGPERLLGRFELAG